jgi:hypothetical protein
MFKEVFFATKGGKIIFMESSWTTSFHPKVLILFVNVIFISNLESRSSVFFDAGSNYHVSISL